MSFISTLHDWQDLTAGVLGFGGAIGAILYTVKSDRDKHRRELRKAEDDAKAFRQALGVELRDMATNALKYYRALQPPPGPGQPNKSVNEIRHWLRFVEPVIYRQNAGRISLVGRRASAVVAFYSKIEFAMGGIDAYRDDQKQWPIAESDRKDMVRALAGMLVAAQTAIPGLEPMTEVIAARDVAFLQSVEETLASQPAPED